MSDLTHLGPDGRPRMVDVSAKQETDRRAVAAGFVRIDEATLGLARTGINAKGSVVQVAELAGIMAAKRTHELIPLCHQLPLSGISVSVDFEDGGLRVTAEARTTARTGVEMEALCAVSVACLTLYDMLKAKARGMTIERIQLLEKGGGASGDWLRD
jgi:cyclic pyranopterin phosphate synthase